MQKFRDKFRAIILVVIVLVSMALCGVRLMKIQIVDGEEYLEKSKQNTLGTQEIHAARGEIVDLKGIPIVKNKVGFNVIMERAFLPDDLQEENEIILRVAKLLEKDGVDWVENIPITKSIPYEYLPDRDRDIKVMLDTDHLRLQSYATPQDCIDEIIKKYEISDRYNIKERRIIAGIRYEMLLRNFSLSNRYTFAEDVPIETVSKLKELSYNLPGVDIVEEAIREYAQGDILAHGIGTVGPIFAEEYKELKNEGYKLNDTLGKSGIEKAMEKQLRGHNGTRQITISNGEVTSVKVTDEAVPGNTVQLTIDSEFQRKVQSILENHIKWLNENAADETKGKEANAGAIAVLDVKTGAVLALVNYPTYDINDYINDYSEVASRENSPLINRAIDGLYRPGSTFKPVSATAALNEGIIKNNEEIYCGQFYTYYNDIRPKCTGFHRDIDVVHALQVSCNIFFYDVGRRTGIDLLQKYAAYYGLGENLGLEIGGSAGHIAGPQYFEQIGQNWTPGQVLQTAIGQSETAVTPLQMAVQAMTIANRGVRYQPYLVDSVHTYNMEEEIYKKQPVIASQIPINNDKMYDLIHQGMINAANLQYFPPEHALNTLPGTAAIKTGTPQKTVTRTHSAFIGFYPAEDPEIAFAGMVELGESSKWMIRDIIEAYYGYEPLPSPEETAANGAEPPVTTEVTTSVQTAETIGQ